MFNLFDKIAPKEDYKSKVRPTQEHLPIKDIHDNVIILKDGSIAAVLQTTAVNFDLLSEIEQLAIISSFAGLLNSLSFSIQIVIRSKRLDISQYVNSIRELEKSQTNPLLLNMTQNYRVFVENLIQENEVLDKQFYVVIPISYLELGIISNIEKNFKKALSILEPRKDHITKQLARIGLRATQLTDDKLIHLFYEVYNETFQGEDIQAFVDNKVLKENKEEQPINQTTQPPLGVTMKEESPVQEEKPNPEVVHLNVQAADQFSDIGLSPRTFDQSSQSAQSIASLNGSSNTSPINKNAVSYLGDSAHRPGTAFIVTNDSDNQGRVR